MDAARDTGATVTARGQTSRRVVLPSSVTSVRTARTQLAGFLRESGVADSAIDDAVVILSELVTNAVRHARHGPGATLRVEWSLKQRRLRLQVTDAGRAGRSRPLHDSGAVGGRGLSIVAALADSWTLERAEQGTTVTAYLTVP